MPDTKDKVSTAKALCALHSELIDGGIEDAVANEIVRDAAARVVQANGGFSFEAPLQVAAQDVQVGDTVVDDAARTVVTEVRHLGPAPKHGSELVFLAGAYNRCRFAHELVTVERATTN